MIRRRVLPTITRGGILEVVLHADSFVLIAHAVSGSRWRYHAIRVFYDGRARCIGNELPRRLARECAARSSADDDKPLTASAGAKRPNQPRGPKVHKTLPHNRFWSVCRRPLKDSIGRFAKSSQKWSAVTCKRCLRLRDKR